MMRITWLVALSAGALLVIHTGCDECVDRFDCVSKGENLICSDNRCVPGQPQPQEDGGATADAGVSADAGTDAGTDAGVDAGPGPSCTMANPVCAGPFHCDLSSADGGSGTCLPLLIGVTASGGPGVERAMLVRFNSNSVALTLGGVAVNTRLPRFSKDGSAVVYVQSGSDGGVLLRRHALTGTASDITLAEASDAGTLDFIQLEYAPADKVLWTIVGPMNSKSGIQWVPGAGGRVQTAVASGGYGDWFPSGSELAFTKSGVSTHSLADAGTRSLATGTSVEPAVSPDGNWIAFLKPNPAIADVYSTGLYTIAATGGSPNTVLADTPAVGTAADGGTMGTLVTNASWARNGQLVFVRENWFRDATGMPNLCTPQDAICNGATGQQIVFQQLDATGKPNGAPVVHGPGVAPAVSPDGSFLAYVVFNGTRNQDELHVVPIDQNGAATDAGFVHSFPSLSTGDKDSRPRWQPK